jgi:hypothetical protein
MFSYTEIVVCLWLFPVVLQITLPLLMLVSWLIIKLLGLIIGKIGLAPQGIDYKEKRLSDRVNVYGSMVDISDNYDRISGKISNVSMSGICIHGLPEEKLRNSNKLFLRVNREEGAFSMLVKTKWEYTQQSGRIIGAKIENAPSGWAEFVTEVNQLT